MLGSGLKSAPRISTQFAITLVVLALPALCQPTATLTGQVLDQSDALVPTAQITLKSATTGSEHTVRTDLHGRYQIAAVPVGIYRLSAWAPGFQTHVVDKLTLLV